ncbi:MAG TPA: DoxX family protein [Chitinophagaceae bacterium]|jgi:hypothetical protein|nr:DoxX family protein [Chitinophagaceae bacterium]
MARKNKWIFWIATIWLSLGMLSSGIVQLFHLKEETQFILDLGYPVYFLTLLGTGKLLGVIALLLPGRPLLKEWAYAGFFFMMTGAAFSHIAAGSPAAELYPSLLLLVLTVVSWYFRPADRRIVSLHA